MTFWNIDKKGSHGIKFAMSIWVICVMERIDRILYDVGGYRRWHMLVYGVLALVTWSVLCWNILSFIFIGKFITIYNITGGGQKLRTGSLYLPVADNNFKWMYFVSVLLANGSYVCNITLIPPLGQYQAKQRQNTFT